MTSTQSPPPRVRWPYKQLWNLLRGESILADDEVILEELRESYEHIIKALTQYEAPSPVDSKSSSENPDDKTQAKQPEDKIKSRISEYLELEESVAWELFCSYMMFEYKGSSTSFDKLLETPKVTNEFLSDLKVFYKQERTSILLCLQALLGNLNDTDHKYHHIFEAFKNWADENGAADLTKNLLKSLDCADGEREEIEVLHALSILTYQMPHLSIKVFLAAFKGFKPGNKSAKLLKAEATVMYSVLLVSGFPSPDFPEEFGESIEEFLGVYAIDILSNEYAMGAVVGGFVSACHTNHQVQVALTSSPHPSANCVPLMTEMAEDYSQDSILNRHNLSEIVLKGLYDAVKAIFDNLDSAIPHFGIKSSYYAFLVTVLRHSSITKIFLVDKPDLMNFYTDAMVLFPLDLQWLLGMWSSMCGTVDDPEDAQIMLDDLTGLLTSVSEYSSDPALAYPRVAANYKNPRDRIVAGITIPAGCEIAYLATDEAMDCFLVTWDLKTSLPVNPWVIILEEVLMPVVRELQNIQRGLTIQDNLELWTERKREMDNVTSLLHFLTSFSKVASGISPELQKLLEAMSFVMLSTLELVRDMKVKAVLAADLIDLVTTANQFGDQSWTHPYLNSIWPGRLENSSCIQEIIMGHESVVNNDCKVTLAFLKSVLGFFKESNGSVIIANPALITAAISSVTFITDNVFHSFTRWRMESEEVKFKVLVNCLKVYNAVFACQEEEWNDIKIKSALFLLKDTSSLMTVLSTDEVLLQQSVIKPEKEVYLLPEVIYESLSLLLKLFQYQKQSIRLVDVSLGLTLVQKLGRFARHRLDYKIPTLAMSLLKKIAEELNMSLLSCFGSDEVAFRDLILQRLEFRSEDVNLKVAILEFLTVAAHTQPGLIQYVFMDEVLAQKIVDLPLEKDEGLSLSVLLFLRALFRKGAKVVKKCSNLWENVFSPIKLLKMGGRVKIITCVLHIATLEMFDCGMTEPVFSTELQNLLQQEKFLKMVKIALSDQTEIRIKCLYALKHFLTVVISRNDLADAFPEMTRKSLLDLMTETFWDDKEKESVDHNLAIPMADIIVLLAASIGEYPEYLEKLSKKLLTQFFGDCVAVQVALLTLTNDCLIKVSSPLKPEIVENIVRVVCRVFMNATKLFEDENLNAVHPILRIAAVVVCTIVKSNYCSEWDRCFDHHLLTTLVVSVANIGISSGRGPEIVMECLHVMTRMADGDRGSKMLQYSDLSVKIWNPIAKWATPEVMDAGSWDEVYLLCLHLMTKLLQKQTYFFLDECLNFWVIHGMYIVHKLWCLSEMTKHCNANNPEQNYRNMISLLNFNVFVLDAIAAMIPYYEEWKIRQNDEHRRVMEGVFTALSTSVNLLNQPHYLTTLISFKAQVQPPHLEVRVTPQLLELQSKLWDIMGGSCLIYWKLRGHSTEFVSSDIILAAVHQVAQAGVKALTKSEKKSRHTSGPNLTRRITDTLERALCIFHFHGHLVLQDSSLSPKQLQNFKREIVSDLTALCDSLRRGVSSNEFLTAMCKSLEYTFNSDIIFNESASVPPPLPEVPLPNYLDPMTL